jgi:hypothetical protein
MEPWIRAHYTHQNPSGNFANWSLVGPVTSPTAPGGGRAWINETTGLPQRFEYLLSGGIRIEHVGFTLGAGGGARRIPQACVKYLNYASARSGRNSVMRTRWYGPGLQRVGLTPDAYASNSMPPGVFGYDGINYRFIRGAKEWEIAIEINGVDTDSDYGYIRYIDNDGNWGCHKPAYHPKGSQGGIEYMGTHDNMDCSAGGLYNSSIFMARICDRHFFTMSDANGKHVTYEQWKDNNLANPGQLPFQFTTQTNAPPVYPPFWDPAMGGQEYPEDVPYKWGSIWYDCSYLRNGYSGWSDSTNSQINIDDAHLQRVYRCPQTLVLSYNCPLNRDLLRHMAEYYRLSNAEDMDGVAWFGNRESVSCADVRTSIDGGTFVGERYHLATGGTSGDIVSELGRGPAWSVYIMILWYHVAQDTDTLVSGGQTITSREQLLPYFQAWFENYRDLIPGGPGYQNGMRRIAGSETPGFSSASSQAEDLHSDRYSFANGTLTNMPFRPEYTEHYVICRHDLNPHPRNGQTPQGPVGTLSWRYNDGPGFGRFWVYDIDNGDFADGDIVSLYNGSTGSIHSPSAGETGTWEITLQSDEPFKNRLNRGLQQSMQNNMQCYIWYLLGQGVFDNVNNSQRDTLLEYVVDYTKAYTDTIPDGLFDGDNRCWFLGTGSSSGFQGGWHKKFAFSVISPPRSNWAYYNVTPYTHFPPEDLPEYSLLEKATDLHGKYWLFPWFTAFYAAETLGIAGYGAVNLDNEFLRMFLKLGLSPELWDQPLNQATYEAKIDVIGDKSAESNYNAWDFMPHWLPWAGEVQYQIFLITGIDGSGGGVSGTTVRNVRIGVSNKTGPGQIYFAAPQSDDAVIPVENIVSFGNQRSFQFYERVDDEDPDPNPIQTGASSTIAIDPIDRPDFNVVLGEQNFIQLWGADGIKGGRVETGTELYKARPFWVALKLEENEAPGSIYYTFRLISDEDPESE